MMPLIEYDVDDKGSIVLPTGAPFDGKPVLIKLAEGWCEAWWEESSQYTTPDGLEYEGFCWVCLDDKFDATLDDAKEWLPLPQSTENSTNAD